MRFARLLAPLLLAIVLQPSPAARAQSVLSGAFAASNAGREPARAARIDGQSRRW